MLYVLVDWSKYNDENKQIDTVYLDIKKTTFDTVTHQRLLLKLKKYGIEGDILKWMEDFFKRKKTRVVLNGKYSSWKKVISGIPQGSVLPPVLFIIYVKDMPDSLNSFCKIFMDDSKLYTAVENKRDQIKLQRDLIKVCKWSKQWLLDFSVQKCKVIQYGNVHEQFEYKLLDKDSNP